MAKRVSRRLALPMMVLAALAARSASAAPVLSAKTLICAGSGPQSGSISVSQSRGTLTLRFRAANLVPGQAVSCGYTCGMVFTSGPAAFCGTVGTSGKLSAKVELPVGTCFGFIPFLTTPSTGKCVPSTVP